MASTFVLSGTAMPQSHRHHGHGHTHSRSRSPTHLGTLNRSFKLDTTSAPLPDQHSDHTHEHAPTAHTEPHHDHEPHGHSHSHLHSHSHSGGSKMQARQHIPAPLLTGNGFTTTSTAAGKLLVTPKNASFAESYEAPEAKPSKSAHDNSAERSRFTNMLLPYTAKWPLLHSVMTEKDSRRIFYFMSLNFSFMAVQAFYGYVTDSLGLLSDSIHMFFDCVALAVGLFASVASKWPPSARFPYGFGKVETLSGFANGVFLVLISVEIMIEAFERIIEGRETKRLAELFIHLAIITTVMIMGIATDTPTTTHIRILIRIRIPTLTQMRRMAIHTITRIIMPHTIMPITITAATLILMTMQENMYGIYLHVLADTLGSAAVIVSTVLTHFIPWSGWDPLASFLIAALIMASSVPLIRSSAQRLLLTVPDEIEYTLRDTLSGIMSLRGVAGYSVPKFWVNDRVTDSPSDRLLGSMHILATRNADMEDVRMRVRHYLADKGMDITLQVEREGDPSCWCGVGKMPMSPLSVTTPMSASTPTSAIAQRLKAR